VLKNSDLRVLRAWLGVGQGFFSFPLIVPFPLVVSFSGDAKVPAGFGNIADLLTVLQYAELASDV
jgi:hypothetical protein